MIRSTSVRSILERCFSFRFEINMLICEVSKNCKAMLRDFVFSDTGNISMKRHPHSRQEADFLSNDEDKIGIFSSFLFCYRCV